jgi:hypothetical protein
MEKKQGVMRYDGTGSKENNMVGQGVRRYGTKHMEQAVRRYGGTGSKKIWN